MRLRIQSLIALFSNHGYLQKSLQGLIKDMPDVYAILKKHYEEAEAYALLEMMVNRASSMDERYMFWVKNGDLPHIIEIKDFYTPQECLLLAQRTNITSEEFDEIIKACGDSFTTSETGTILAYAEHKNHRNDGPPDNMYEEREES